MTKYLFVRDFDWRVFDFKVEYDGHPQKGRVYKAEYDPSTQSHIIQIPNGKKLQFESIQTKNEKGELFDYTADMVELTPKNILDFDIADDDLNKIINQNEVEEAEMMNLPMPLQHLFTAMANQHKEEQAILQDTVDKLSDLYQHNIFHVEIISDLIDFLVDLNLSTVEDPASQMELDGEMGKGMNISHAMRHLAAYVSKDRKINDFEEDLYEAVGAIFRELERRRVCDIE